MLKVVVFMAALIFAGFAARNPPRPDQKIIKIAIFLDDDEHSNITEIAINNAMDMLTNYKRQEYYVIPHIYKLGTKDTFKAGQIVCELVQKGIAAIFGPESPDTNDIIQSVSSSLEIPHFQTFWNPKLPTFSSEVDKYKSYHVFNLYPNPYSLAEGIATLVRENDWTTYTVLYEDDDGLMRLNEVLRRMNPKQKAVTFRKLKPGIDDRTVLKEIKAAGELKVILDCHTNRILEILTHAREVKLLEEYHSYILTNLDAHTLDWSEFRNTKSNISGMRVLDPVNSELSKAVHNWELTELHDHNRPIQILPETIRTKTALLYDALNVFITAFAELETTEKLTVNGLNCDDEIVSSHGFRLSYYIRERITESGLLLGPLSGPVAFDENGSRTTYQIQVIEFANPTFRVVGTWDPRKPQILHAVVTSEDRDKELQKRIHEKNFKVVSRLVEPYFMERKPPVGTTYQGNDKFEGYAVDLIKEICKIWNCSFTFYIVPDGLHGSLNPITKQWNGLIGYLLDRKADLAIGDLTITYERRKAVDFTLPFMTLGISILYAKAIKEPPELLSFSHPLSLDVWLYMATAYIVISVVIYLVARLNPNDWENPHPCDENPQELENIWNLKNCFWLTMGSIMAQGCDILPKGISTRLVTGMWWFFSLIMTASYTANLAAFLTMERMGPTIESAEDLASQTKIKYGCLEGGSTCSFFRDSNFSTYHRMWVQMEQADPSVFEKNNKDGVKRVLGSKRKYAFLMESASIEYEMERHCDLMQVGGMLDSKGYGIAMPTNGPYRKSVNEAILIMQERGKLDQLKNKWWKEMNDGGQCREDKHDEDATAAELGLDHVGGVFVVLAAGVSLALLIAAGEFLWSVRKVAVVQKLTLKEAFRKEFKFAVNIWARRKSVLKTPSDSIR